MGIILTLDTNILLDSILKREPWVSDSAKILRLNAKKKIRASITTNMITDIYYIAVKVTGKAQIREAITTFLKIFDIIPVDRADCKKALASGIDDFEDALLSVCAMKNKSKYIITRNVKDFAGSAVPAIEPSEFLEEFSE